MPQKKKQSVVDWVFWGRSESKYNTLAESRWISFTKLQIVRVALIALATVTWILNFYINVRKSFLYLNFWSLTFTVASEILLFAASGPKFVEKILEERGKPVPLKKRS